MAQVINMFDDEEAPEELDEEEASEPEADEPEAFAKQGTRPITTTRARERMVEQVPGFPEPEPVLQLLSEFGNNGAVRVALASDGQRMEQWRTPTKEEWALLQQRGRLIKGGIGASPAPAAQVLTQAVAPQPAAASLLPKLLLGGLAVAAAGTAFYFWRQNKEMEDNVEEID